MVFVAGFMFSPLHTSAASSWLSGIIGVISRLNGNTATITGRLTYSDRSAASGAGVFTNSISTKTDANGYYRLGPISIGSGGTTSVTVTFQCMSLREADVLLRPGENNLGTRSCGEKPGNTAIVAGTIRTATGAIPGNLSVMVNGQTVIATGGSYSTVINLGSARSKYISVVFGCQPNPPFNITVSANKTSRVDFKRCPVGGASNLVTGSVSGIITYNGAPVNNAKVVIAGVNSSGWFTDSNGRYSTPTLNIPKTANVTISYATNNTATLPNHSFNAGVNTINYNFSRTYSGTVYGYIKAGTIPLNGVPIDISIKSNTNTVYTNAQGYYSAKVSNLPDSVLITAKYQGAVQTKTVTAATASTRQDFTFVAATNDGQLVGTVKNNGQPVAEASVDITAAAGSTPKSYKTNSQGRYSSDKFSLGTTLSKVVISLNGQSKTFENIKIVQTQTILDWSFTTPTANLDVSVLYRDTQIPAAGASVSIWQPTRTRFNASLYPMTHNTNANGQYSYTALPLGSVAVRADLDSSYTDATANLKEGNNPLSLYLEPHQVNILRGVIRSTNGSPLPPRLFLKAAADDHYVSIVIDTHEEKEVTYAIVSPELVTGTYNVQLAASRAADSDINVQAKFTKNYSEVVQRDLTWRGTTSSPNQQTVILRTVYTLDGSSQTGSIAAPGVNLVLKLAAGSGGFVTVAEVTTDKNGIATLVNQSLPLGSYSVEVKEKAGYIIGGFTLEDLGGSQIFTFILYDQNSSPCRNYPTSNLPEFWYCGDPQQVEQLYQTSDHQRTLINTIVGRLRSKYSGYDDNPPELAVLDAGAKAPYPWWGLATSYVNYPANNSRCLGPNDASAPFNDNRIYLATEAYKSSDFDIESILVHEWGHLKDFKEGNCASHISNNVLYGLTNVIAQEPALNGFYQFLNTVNFGHPQDNTTELYATGFMFANVQSAQQKLEQAISNISDGSMRVSYQAIWHQLKSVVNQGANDLIQ